MRLKNSSIVLALAALLIAAVLAGCSKSPNAAAQRTDAQLAGDVQTRISSDPALAGKQISINANAGVITLSGNVDSDAAMTSALNDAQQAQGVKQVISKLAVQQASADQPQPTDEQQAAQAQPQPERHERHRSSPSHARSRHSLPSDSTSSAAPPDTTTTADNMGPSGVGSSSAANTYTPPAPPPPPQKVTVPAGTVFQVRTVEGLSSETNHENDVWHGTLNNDVTVGDQTVIPAGADVQGHVMQAHAATHYTGGASLALSIDRLSYNGNSYNISTDNWSKTGSARGKNTAEKVGAGAAIGAVLGGIFGGGKGAAIGATAGAGAGAGANTVTKGQKVELSPESLVSFRLQNPVTVMPAASNQRHGTVIAPDSSSDQ
ncbi:MAG TPA: BON domain-containing protein [Terriglobales bacterium]|nr:BON domain-containing protein [Terriglobales bacterium]